LGVDITPKVETTASKALSANGKRFGVGLPKFDGKALG
jgi:hypothetical protein